MPVFVSYGIIGRDLNDVQMLFTPVLDKRVDGYSKIGRYLI